MNYNLIYTKLIKRGKSRRVKNPRWGAWHRHHIIPKHMGGGNGADNLTTLQVKEHKLAHRLLYKMYGKHADYIAYTCLGKNFTNMWDVPSYREYMLPKVLNNLSKVDRVLAGERAGIVALKTIQDTLNNPDVRARAEKANVVWRLENPEKQADKARFMHTHKAVSNMSVSKSKYIIIAPDGSEYASVRLASLATGHKGKSITNWVIRNHYGWSRKLKVQETGIV